MSETNLLLQIQNKGVHNILNAGNTTIKQKSENTKINDLTYIGDYKVNSDSNDFLKTYIEIRAKNSKVKIPEGFEIQISSPKEFSSEFKKELQYISNEIYKARVVDLFNLLERDSNDVAQQVSKMKISDSDKEKIIKLKSQFDNFYKIELSNGDKKYDLLNLSDNDKNEIDKVSPEFKNFIENEQVNLKQNAKIFTRKEMSALRLNEAGHNSAIAAGGLAAILTFLVGKGVFDSREDANLMKADKKKFLQNQAEIFNEGMPKFKNPIKEFVEAAKNGLTKSSAKNPAKLALAGLLMTTIAGAADDLMGCVKDSIQDTDNFGLKTGLAINIPSALFGIATSMAIAPMIEDEIKFNRAVKYLKENEKDIANLGIDLAKLKNTKSVGSIVKIGGKIAIMATAAALFKNIFKGIITAMSSSGSSWGSMAGTRYVMEKSGNELEEKNIIRKEENTFKNTTENMMAYEAYKGKWTGIAQQDPLIGATGGALGLFTHSNPYIQSLAFGLQGCSETLTACYYQVTGANDRKNKLMSDKLKLVENAEKSIKQ